MNIGLKHNVNIKNACTYPLNIPCKFCRFILSGI